MPIHACTRAAHWFAFGPLYPCQCLKYLSQPNPDPIRVPERPFVRPMKPDGSKGAPVLTVMRQRGQATVTELASELHVSKVVIRRRLSNLRSAHRIMLVGQTTERDLRGYTRTVPIYALTIQAAYPDTTHHA